MEGLKVSEASLIVHIHPSKSNQVSKAVLRELSNMLFTYDEVFDGVVLAYDVNSFDKCAKILPGIFPYFGVNLKVNLLLFSPKPDMLLGIINAASFVSFYCFQNCVSSVFLG